MTKTQMTETAAKNFHEQTNKLREKVNLFGKEYFKDELPREVQDALPDLDIIDAEIRNYTRLVAILNISKNAVLKEIKENIDSI